VPRF
jgi:hypothetical protein